MNRTSASSSRSSAWTSVTSSRAGLVKSAYSGAARDGRVEPRNFSADTIDTVNAALRHLCGPLMCEGGLREALLDRLPFACKVLPSSQQRRQLVIVGGGARGHLEQGSRRLRRPPLSNLEDLARHRNALTLVLHEQMHRRVDEVPRRGSLEAGSSSVPASSP